jgi:hypothetical protein
VVARKLALVLEGHVDQQRHAIPADTSKTQTQLRTSALRYSHLSTTHASTHAARQNMLELPSPVQGWLLCCQEGHRVSHQARLGPNASQQPQQLVKAGGLPRSGQLALTQACQTQVETDTG